MIPFTLIKRFLKKGEYEKALRILNDSLEYPDPNTDKRTFSQAYKLQSKILTNLGRAEEALEAMDLVAEYKKRRLGKTKLPFTSQEEPLIAAHYQFEKKIKDPKFEKTYKTTSYKRTYNAEGVPCVKCGTQDNLKFYDHSIKRVSTVRDARSHSNFRKLYGKEWRKSFELPICTPCREKLIKWANDHHRLYLKLGYDSLLLRYFLFITPLFFILPFGHTILLEDFPQKEINLLIGVGLLVFGYSLVGIIISQIIRYIRNLFLKKQEDSSFRYLSFDHNEVRVKPLGVGKWILFDEWGPIERLKGNAYGNE